MTIRYPLIIPTVGHGSTDLLINPLITLNIHFFSLSIIRYIPNLYKKFILVTTSIYHISKDIKLLPSLLLHSIWLKYPITSKLYLSFFHTPLHYKRCYIEYPNIFNYQISLSFLTTLFIYHGINNNYDLYIQKYLGQYWWIAPIVSHIIINEYFTYQKYLIKQQN